MNVESIFGKGFTEILKNQIIKESEELKLNMKSLKELGIENPFNIVSTLASLVRRNLYKGIDAKKLMKYSIELAKRGISEEDIIKELNTFDLSKNR